MTPYYEDAWLTIFEGDCREVLRSLEPESVNCVVTSPPYFGLRDYGIAPTVWGGDGHEHEWGEPLRLVHTSQPGTEKQASNFGANGVSSSSSSCPCGAWSGVLGLEPTPELYVAHMVEVFREVRRVLRKDGTAWLNLGDSYNGVGRGEMANGLQVAARATTQRTVRGLKPKDRIGIPPRVALALQADGWWWRDEIIWHKPNPMPSSVTDRTTPAHEMVYLLTKSARYWYDAAAIAEERTYLGPNGATLSPYGQGFSRRSPDEERQRRLDKQAETPIPGNGHHVVGFNDRWDASEDAGSVPLTRNRRSVWTVATQPYPEAHFATFPEALVEPMVKAGCPENGVVLDIFAGSGTVGLVAQRLSRKAILVDLNADYLKQCLVRNSAIPLGLVG